MTKTASAGDTVSWKWGEGRGSGKVIEVFTDKVTRSIKGSEITRNASKDSPAYLIEQEDGDRVLKLDSEVTREN
ncbi:DUF2945 domain-containing protein [Pistricoccus aurantiacus]|uniref:DUF2945 domain-containing protein n=1 Tax=Pistricoccus aurantiacus TaxID=1883414 RepID=A0A5B8SQ27_9GAMM|nr:DUF2945 domain-containing protein [Pistricoccus aurantiacus]QEA38826.1 DUF2945 domain-containing protein [Pistricoccus aurantiacus]